MGGGGRGFGKKPGRVEQASPKLHGLDLLRPPWAPGVSLSQYSTATVRGTVLVIGTDWFWVLTLAPSLAPLVERTHHGEDLL